MKILDIEELVVAWLNASGIAPAGVEMDATQPMPFLLVARIAGGDDKVTDHPSVQVDAFHSTRTAASTLATQVHTRMLALNPTVTVSTVDGAARIDRLATIHGPLWVPYRDPQLRRYALRYEIDTRLTY